MPSMIMRNEILPEQSGTKGTMEEGGVSVRTLDSHHGEPAWVECKDMNFSIKGKPILKDINCVFEPNQLVALMGSSGAGKTTLLSVISGRGKGKVMGQVTFNGKRVTRNLMKRKSKLVPQADVLTPVLTARETLRYTAELALRLPKSQREERVEEVIKMLSLQDCADVICGSPDLKGLSGGQLKRVSIGMELLSNPSFLILDEPTSGLDSKIAEDVVDLIKELARGGRTVVCTIHQPSFQVFSKFDRLLMLDKGAVAYDGPVANLSGYLSEIGWDCPQFTNPADHFMTVVSRAPIDGSENYNQVFSKSSFYAESVTQITRSVNARDSYLRDRKDGNGLEVGEIIGDTWFATSMSSQFWTVLRRSFYVTFKDKKQLRTRAIQLTFLGIIMGLIFLRMPMDQDRVQDRLSVFFMVLLFLGMSSIMSLALAMPVEKTVLVREYGNGYYHLAAFFFGRVFVLLFFQVLYAILFGGAIYFVLGLNPTFEAWLVFIVTLVLISVVCGMVGFTAGVAIPDAQAVAAIVPSIIMPLSIFSGLFIPLANIPSYFVWIYYISWFQYGLASMVINEFGSQNLNACTVEQVTNPTGLCPYGPCNGDPFNPQSCPGSVVLDRLDYNEDDLGKNLGILCGFFAGALLLGYFATYRLLQRIK